MLNMKEVHVGDLRTCCYILWSDEAEGCVVIDPGAEPEKILAACAERPIRAILLTHGHFDHIGAVEALAKNGAAIVIHELDAPMLQRSEMNASWLVGDDVRAPEATHLVREGDQIRYAGVELKVLHTPGHTPGSVCYLADDMLFTGDTLFHGGYGRVDLPGGSMEQLRESLWRLRPLIVKYPYYPGH